MSSSRSMSDFAQDKRNLFFCSCNACFSAETMPSIPSSSVTVVAMPSRFFFLPGVNFINKTKKSVQPGSRFRFTLRFVITVSKPGFEEARDLNPGSRFSVHVKDWPEGLGQNGCMDAHMDCAWMNGLRMYR